MKNNTCCFWGHRQIEMKDELWKNLHGIIENLVVEKGIDTFLFGSKSKFNDLCYEVTTKVKEKHPHIKRIYVRAEFPHIDEIYKAYLLKSYEETYFPEKISNAGKAAYIERNFEMIDKSCVCVIYYKDSYSPPKRKRSSKSLTEYQPKSGTKIAYEYALKKNLQIINLG